jgi:prolyl oligopeptidase
MLDMLRLLLTGSLLLATVSAPLPPPAAVPQPVVDIYPGGHKVTDPFRWMENLKSPRVQTYFRQQAEYTNAVVSRLGPGREAIRTDIARFVDARAAIGTLVRVNDTLFYLERPIGRNDARLMVREGDGAPRTLLDPDALGKQMHSSAHLTISQVLPSFDGSRVAVGIVPGGAEYETHTRVVETATGKLLDEDFPRTWFGATAWSPDGSQVTYLQLPKVAAGHEAERERYAKVFRHVIGAAGPDQEIFGAGTDPTIHFEPSDDGFITVSPVSGYAIGSINRGVQNELTLYVAPVASVFSGKPIEWRKIADVEDGVEGFDLKGNTAYLLTHKDAPHFKIVSLDLSKSGATAANAALVLANGDNVLKGLQVAKDGLYVSGLNGGPAVLEKLPWETGESLGGPVPVKLPFPGSFGSLAIDPRVDGVTFSFDSWTKPQLVYALAADGAITDTRLQKPLPIDLSHYQSKEINVPSTDGAQVPVSIIMKRGTKLDGSNPLYLEAYGAYGLDIDPGFLGSSLAWLDEGGVYVVAHVRGGGEKGQDWYEAGKGIHKQHTIDDAIATARYLIANHYTSPSHLAIEGTSAGGIMVGGAITQHPELFVAAIDGVGWTDELRSETEPNGPQNVPEFGSAKTEAGFKQLYAMDAYKNITKGNAYPAVMGVTGINDPRVAPWQVAKFIARLQYSTSSGRPVLMRVDYDAGHGMLAASRAQVIALRTDEFSFLLWQCGSPLFKGIPTHINQR